METQERQGSLQATGSLRWSILYDIHVIAFSGSWHYTMSRRSLWRIHYVIATRKYECMFQFKNESSHSLSLSACLEAIKTAFLG